MIKLPKIRSASVQKFVQNPFLRDIMQNKLLKYEAGHFNKSCNRSTHVIRKLGHTWNTEIDVTAARM